MPAVVVKIEVPEPELPDWVRSVEYGSHHSYPNERHESLSDAVAEWMDSGRENYTLTAFGTAPAGGVYRSRWNGKKWGAWE